MWIITTGKDKGWCRCERCGCLLVPDRARYAAHLENCDGTDSNEFTSATAPFGTVSLARYVASLADVPLPTKQQKENFVDYVSHSHSWYKHLSPYPPGVEFHFFLDSSAGREREPGTPLVKDRLQSGFHYSEIATRVYRSAFGYLAYRVGRTNKIPLVVPVVGEEADIAPADPMGCVFGDRMLAHGLPEEIFAAGATRLTGVIHALCASNLWVWNEDRRPHAVNWPEESGGMRTLEQVFDRCRASREIPEYVDANGPGPHKEYPSSEIHLSCVDPVLHQLLMPERRRQYAEIGKAIDRVCEIVDRVRNGSLQMEA